MASSDDRRHEDGLGLTDRADVAMKVGAMYRAMTRMLDALNRISEIADDDVNDIVLEVANDVTAILSEANV